MLSYQISFPKDCTPSHDGLQDCTKKRSKDVATSAFRKLQNPKDSTENHGETLQHFEVECRRRDLMYLLQYGSKDTLRMALKSGINVTSKRFRGARYFLHLLAENKHDDVFDLLDELSIDFDVNAAQVNKETALMIAARNCSVRKVEFLINRGADAKLIANHGNTIFTYAAMYPNLDREKDVAKITTLLLQNGANIQKVNDQRKSVLDIFAIYSKHKLATIVLMAHLALAIELRELKLTERTLCEIETEIILKVNFDRCTEHLVEMKKTVVRGNVTLFKLLTENDDKILKYTRSRKLVSKYYGAIKEKSYLEPYYLNIMQEKMLRACIKNKQQKKAALVIEAFTGISKDVYQRIVYQIISYFNSKDLNELSQVKKILIPTTHQ